MNYLPLQELSLCWTCIGCSRLEMKNFVGVVKCNNYIIGDTTYYKRMNKDYGVAVDHDRSKEDIIDKYWRGD